MNVLLFIDSLTGAGAQRQLANLAVGLAGRGHRVTVVTYAALDFHRPRLLAHGVDCRCFPKRGRFDLRPAWHLLRAIDEIAPDAVVAFLRTPSIYAEALRPLRPSLRLIVSERAGVRGHRLEAADILAGVGHLLASAVTANSHDYVERLTAALPPLRGRTHVIYNGIDPAFLTLGERRLADEAGRGSEPVNGPLRLCVVAARANAQKAPLALAQAAAMLRAGGVDSFFIDWIGPVDNDTELVRQTRQVIAEAGLTDHWRWHGACDDVSAVYPEYDALLLPSIYEGVANSMCEAMAAGLPVVATDIADNRRILEPAGAGLICRAGDAGALAQSIAGLIALTPAQRRAMGAAAHQQARELFSMSRFVDRWEALCAGRS